MTRWGTAARGFALFLFFLPACPAQDAPDLAQLSRHKEAWPAKVALKASLPFPIVLDGKPVGSTVAATGTVVDLVAVGEKELKVSLGGAQATVAPDQTDLAERLAAAPPSPASSTPAAAPPPPAAPAPAPGPAAKTPAPAPPAAEETPLALDFMAKPQANYTMAAYRFWCPAYDGPVRGILVLTPGANGDGRGMAADKAWQALARKYGLAIVALFMQGPGYYEAARGSGDALLDALRDFARQAGRPEIATAPLVLWGHSAGGQFDYDFVLWKPDRVAAFVVNKGGYYAPDAPSAGACAVPGLFFLGMKDEDFRVKAITGIWTAGRKKNALWALAPEPGAQHEVSATPQVSRVFFEGVLPRRLPDGPGALRPLHEEDGWTGDLPTHEIQPAATPARRDDAWLPSEASANAWKEFVSPK